MGSLVRIKDLHDLFQRRGSTLEGRPYCAIFVATLGQ